jgi:hypothetical protein
MEGNGNKLGERQKPERRKGTNPGKEPGTYIQFSNLLRKQK